MDLSTISVRYAKAFYLLGKEKDLLDQIKNDILVISGSIKYAPDFKMVIESPVIKPSLKINAISAIFKDKIHALTLNFLTILVKNKREQNLEGICRRFLNIYAEGKGIKTALITTVLPLDDKENTRLTEILSRTFQAQIEVEHKLSPEILGGYILKVGDQQYDASVASSLRKMRQALLKPNYSKN